MGCALINGMQSAPNAIAACGKHFPGHGDTSVDSHLDLPALDHDLARLEHIELLPFAAAITAGVAAIMTSHILFRALDQENPATMSSAIIDGLLRRTLGFQGVVISDDLEMGAIIDHVGVEHAVVRGAAAGVDLFLICHRSDRQHAAIDALCRAVADGHIPCDRIEQANRRLDALFNRFVQSVNSPSIAQTQVLV
jgi:beta-N-acetylhexosaminidase